MNKHGQTLILFVILIPIIIICMAIVVDVGLVIGKKIQLEEVTKNIIKDAYLSDEKIIQLYKKNNIDVSNLEILRDNDKLKIEIKLEVKSIFGGIVGIKKYDIVVKITGYIKDDKIILE